ncbi:MFS transporter [Gorillibacterium massiliense]|uniref:MFS transporter n=1 Tax=Gorillibacterium massiliense TaxID=1280390 RepID=UPI0004B72A41|nr:MFS transporter [Gorillibacterium massiliense]
MNLLSSYSKEIKVFLAAGLINAIGGSLMWPLISMFVFDELGRSMKDAGLVILIQALGGIAGQLLGGALYHKIGVQRLIVGALAMNTAGLLSLPLISNDWNVFVPMMGFIGFCNALSMPAIQAFVGFRFPERRAELFNVIYVANNIGVAVGTALSGFLAEWSYNMSFILNGASSGVFAVFFLFYLRNSGGQRNEQPQAAAAKKITGAIPGKMGAGALLGHYRIYLFIGLGGLMLQVGNSIWNTGVSPSILAAGMSKSNYGYLWTLNGILIFAAQPFITLVKKIAAKSVTAQMTASSIFYLAGYAVILLLPTYSGFILGMILATFGEMLIAPAVPAFLSEHGGRNAPFYIGLVGGIGSVGRVFGPYVMGSLYDAGGLSPTAYLAVITAAVSVAMYHIQTLISRRNSQLDEASAKGETILP